MGNVTKVYARVWAQGRGMAAADAAEELEKIVKETLATCVRLTAFVDKAAFAERLIGRRIPADVAHMIANTAEINDDNAFFSDKAPY